MRQTLQLALCHRVFKLRDWQRDRPNTGPLQMDTIRDIHVRCVLGGLLHQKGWLETQLNLPMVEGQEPLDEYKPGPPALITQYAANIKPGHSIDIFNLEHRVLGGLIILFHFCVVIGLK